MNRMVSFIGAGPGAVDLVTVGGQKLLSEADVVIYARSLVNKGLLNLKKDGCEVHNSASMTLDEVITVMVDAFKKIRPSRDSTQATPLCTARSENRWTRSNRTTSRTR